MADYYTTQIKGSADQLKWMGQQSRSTRIADVRKDAAALVERAKKCQYTYEAALSRVLEDHPEIQNDYIIKHYGISLNNLDSGYIVFPPYTLMVKRRLAVCLV